MPCFRVRVRGKGKDWNVMAARTTQNEEYLKSLKIESLKKREGKRNGRADHRWIVWQPLLT